MSAVLASSMLDLRLREARVSPQPEILSCNPARPVPVLPPRSWCCDIAAGVVGASIELTAQLRELLVLCEAGWPQPQAPTPAAPAAPPVAVQQQPAVPLPMPLGRASQPPSSAHPGAAAAGAVEAEADAAADDALANICGDSQQAPGLTRPQASVSAARTLHAAAAPFTPASAAFPAASAAAPGSEASVVPTPPQAVPASPASMHLWPPPPAPQALPQAAPQAALRDEWEYLAPDDVTVYGPFSMRQLLYWAEKGHMDGEVKVGPGCSAGKEACRHVEGCMGWGRQQCRSACAAWWLLWWLRQRCYTHLLH